MKKIHKSYKLQDDSVEQEAHELQRSLSEIWKSRELIKQLTQQISEVNKTLELQVQEKEEHEARIIELLRRQHKTSVTLNRVRYYIDGNELKRQILLEN